MPKLGGRLGEIIRKILKPPYTLELEPRKQGGRGYARKYEVYIRTLDGRKPYDLDESYDIYLDGVRVGSAKTSEFVIYVNGKGKHEIRVQKSEGFRVVKSNIAMLNTTSETIESLKISPTSKTELDANEVFKMNVYANGKLYPYMLTDPKYTIYVDGYEIMHTNAAEVGWFVDGRGVENGDKIGGIGKHKVWVTVTFANGKLKSNTIEYKRKCSGYIGVIDARKTNLEDFACLGTHEASGGLTIYHKKSITYHGRVYTADDNEKYHIEISDTLGHKLSADVINGASLSEFMSTGTYHISIIDELGNRFEKDVGISSGAWTNVTFVTDYGRAPECPTVTFTSNRKSFGVIGIRNGYKAFVKYTDSGKITLPLAQYGNYEIYGVLGGEVIKRLASFTKPKDFPFHVGNWTIHFDFASNTGKGTLRFVNCGTKPQRITLVYKAPWSKENGGSFIWVPDEVLTTIHGSLSHSETFNCNPYGFESLMIAGDYLIKNASGEVIGEVFLEPEKKVMVDVTKADSGKCSIIGFETTFKDYCSRFYGKSITTTSKLFVRRGL